MMKTNSLKSILLVDGNHLIYRAYFKFKGLHTLDGKPTSILYGGPYILESIIRRLGPDKVMVAFDDERSKYRLSIWPTYKDRESKLGDDKENFHAQKDELIQIFTSLGLTVFKPKGYEADDTIAYLTQQYYKMGWEVTVVSADKDFVQLINDRVTLFNVNKGIIINENNCMEHYGYTPKQCVDYLSLLGDESDKIPGYSGIGPAKAAALLKQYGSIKKFLNTSNHFGKVDKIVLKDISERNYKLINLMHFIRKELKPEDIEPINKVPELNRKKFANLCLDSQINSFNKPQFINTFIHLFDGK